MSQFSDLVDRVGKLSNRPDMLEEIKQSIRDATRELHHTDFFYKDLVTGIIEVTGSGRQEVTIPISTFANLRAIKDIVPNVAGSSNPFNVCAVPKLVSNPSLSYCRCNTNWWRVLGGQLTISTNQNVAEFNLYYYQHPVVGPTDSDYTSWISAEYEEAVIDLSLAKLFAILRDYSASNLYQGKVGSRDRLSGHIAVIVGDNLEQEIRTS